MNSRGNIRRRRKIQDKTLQGLSALAMFGVLMLAMSLVGYVLVKGVPHIHWDLLSTSPSYIHGHIGILPDIVNTIYMILGTLAMVMPLGIGAAIYLQEYAKDHPLANIISFAAETLAGIPSIIYGLVGMLLFCEFFGLKTSILAGAMTLALMNLPIMMRTTQESLKTVPESYREGAFALGAGKWRVIRTVVLPSVREGILTGVILTMGRVIGESAALLFTAGFAHALNGPVKGMKSAGATLTVALYVYAKEQGEFGVAFGIGAVLMVLVVLLNLAATWMGKAGKRKL